MAKRQVAVVDFESEGIEPRPDYPPRPVGVSIKLPGRKARYYAWGHPTGNNCTKEQARGALKEVWDGELVFHNFGFDLEVAEVHLGLPIPPWHRVHCTQVLGFLIDPHARNLGLKPLAEKDLGMPPEERDKLRAWLIEHVPGATKTNWGAYISLAPGGLVAEYADGDTTRTEGLFRKYHGELDAGLREAYDRERRLLPHLLREEKVGIRVDHERLARDTEAGFERLEALDQWLRKRLRAPGLNIDSDNDLADAIERAGLLAPSGWVMTPKGNRSTAAEALREAVTDKALLAALTYRGPFFTALNTFMTNWLIMAEVSGGKIYTRWNQTRNERDKGARTGRLSSEPNFQNIMTELEKIMAKVRAHRALEFIQGLPRVRSYILPDHDNHVIVDRDYNSQEMRLFAHFEDGLLCEGYKKDPWMDAHQLVTDLVNPLLGGAFVMDRDAGKTQNFGKLYGQGIGSTARKLGVPYEIGQLIDRAYKTAFPGVKDVYKDMKARAKAGEPIRTIGGRRYYCEPPRVLPNGRLQEFDYKMVNYLVQPSAADQTKEAIIQYMEAPKRRGRWMLSVHDENGASVEKRAWKEEMRVLKEAMEGALQDRIDVPMLSNGSWGPNFADLTELSNGE